MSPDQDSPFDASDDQLMSSDPLDALDSSLLDNIAEDARLNSGVPGGQRVSDLDFIQMAGLTRNVPSESDDLLASGDMDPNKPVSFFEAGIADVDASMAPKTPFDLGSLPDEDIIPNIPTPAAPKPPQPAAPTVMSAAPIALPDEDEDDLLKAERLLQALEAQPRDFQEIPEVSEPKPMARPLEPPISTPPMAPVRPAYLDRPVEPPVTEEYDDQAESDMSVYGKPIPPKNLRRAKRPGANMRRKLVRFAVTLIVLACMGGGGVIGYRWMSLRLAKPEELLSQAGKMLREQRYDEAPQTYLNFVNLHPNHPARPEAQLEAAFALSDAPDDSFDETKARRTQALTILNEFVEQNPGHVKVARARILMGILNFKLGNNDEAIALLRDQNLLMSDAPSMLPALRTLAQVYLQTGAYDDAESAYLQAVALEENSAPDFDYNQLGDLFKKRGDEAQGEADRIAYHTKATEYWMQAIRMPGVNPVDKGEIKKKYEWLRTQLGLGVPAEENPAAEAKPHAENATAAPAAEAKPAAPAIAPLVADPAAKEINPALEAPKPVEQPAVAPAPAPEPTDKAAEAPAEQEKKH